MSERSERLFRAFGEIDEQNIEQAAPEEGKRFRWKRWTALAAALVLAVGVGGYVLSRMDSSSPGMNNVGGAGAGGASTFTSYAGPVFPLTLKEADRAISAEREITMKVREWSDCISQWGMQVTDSYTLTNTSTEDRTVSVLYPFVSELQEVWNYQPVLMADGRTLDTILHAGAYVGGFRGVDGPEDERRFNLSAPSSWEDYRGILEDGSYQDRALGEYPDLSDISVTVYRFTGYYGPEPDSQVGIPNPTIRAGFDLDYDKTTVLSYGFHGGRFDKQAGTMIQSFSIPESDRPWYGEPYYLIVLGDDIANLTTGGYVTGGTDPDTQALLGCGVDVERYTTDLDAALREVTQLIYNSQIRNSDEFRRLDEVDYEMYHGLFCGYLLSYGLLSDHPAERYQDGWLGSLDVANVDRVFYLEAQVDIPAGGSVRLMAEMTKAPSYDFYCAHIENQVVHSYDMVTKLGSNLNCTQQTAVLEELGQYKIVRQNFGFDLDNGVKRVTLDPGQEHYYLEIKKILAE